jgi:hypothetical protein
MDEGIYQLASVVAHSGNYTHGHYISYLRVGSNLDWYQFNHWVVTHSNEIEAIRNFGGGSPDDFCVPILVYVRIDAIAKVFRAVVDSAVPAIVQNL